MISKSELIDMSDIDITNIDKSTLVDVDTIHIDPSQPIEKRMETFITAVKNPYCFLCGDTPVRVRYVSNKKSLEQSLGDYFISLK